MLDYDTILMASFIWSYFAIGLVSRTRSSIRVENKVVPMHSMKTYSGNEGTAPRFLTLGSRRRSLVGLTSRPSCPRCLQNRGLGAFTNKTGGPHVQAVLSTVPTEQGAGCVYKQDWWSSRPGRLVHGAYRTGGWVRLQRRLRKSKKKVHSKLLYRTFLELLTMIGEGEKLKLPPHIWSKNSAFYQL